MVFRGQESDNAANESSEQEVQRILAICLPGAHDLLQAFESTLSPLSNLQITRANISDTDVEQSAGVLCARITKCRPRLVILCLGGESTVGAEWFFRAMREHLRELSVLVVAEGATLNQLDRLLILGAADFCLAPFRSQDLIPRVLRWSLPVSQFNGGAQQSEKVAGLQQFLGESPIFQRAVSKIPKLAQCDASLLITGETGTGKEMCARAIHHLGLRAQHPFVPVNCGAIPSELLENELFGHEAGAFTSAKSSARGLVYEAEGGTLFLDEVDSLPLQMQVKLLRFLQDREYRPLGARKTLQANMRIISACNSDLEEAVRLRKFRADLFYRLNVLPLSLPALRERKEDIPLLARHFAIKHATVSSNTVKEFSRCALDKLNNYQWPGNVRELENIIERAVFLCEGSLITREEICLPGPASSPEDTSFKALKQQAIADFETGYIRRLLAANEGNISKAAREARKNRRAFWQLMRKYEIGATCSERLIGELDKTLESI